MAARRTIHLPDDLDPPLKTAPARPHCTRAEVIQNVLDRPGKRDPAPAEPVRHLLGSLESGIPDLAENHRAYVVELIRLDQGA